MSDYPLRLPRTCLDPCSDDESDSEMSARASRIPQDIVSGSKRGAESEEEATSDIGQTIRAHIGGVQLTDSQGVAEVASPHHAALGMSPTPSAGSEDIVSRPSTATKVAGKRQRRGGSQEVYHRGEFNPVAAPMSSSQVYCVVVRILSTKNALNLQCLAEYMTKEVYDDNLKTGRYAQYKKVSFLPLPMNEQHIKAIGPLFMKSMRDIASKHSERIFPMKQSTPPNELIMRILPNLLCKCVVHLAEQDEMPDNNAIRILPPLYRLYRWAIATNEMQPQVEELVGKFVASEGARHKTQCRDIGEWLALFSASQQYSWVEVREVYLEEYFRRMVLWSIKDDYSVALSMNDSRAAESGHLQKVFEERRVGLRLTAILAWFAQNISNPSDSQSTHTHPDNLRVLIDIFTRVYAMTSWQQWFQLLGYQSDLSDTVIFDKLRAGIDYAINDKSYQSTRGGWRYINHKYPDGTHGNERPMPILDMEHDDI